VILTSDFDLDSGLRETTTNILNTSYITYTNSNLAYIYLYITMISFLFVLLDLCYIFASFSINRYLYL
jgi:hypothetical protein